ncbi:hypothetical protein QC761_510890 [Podospora bellae-mahoneyi]|uniref:Uncharacterized protein n=1 Tax=Podospora bellae-mahoneyi TaxID=2093777 RepID=A0ABR0FH76_9PEZI|nr:hypothetical protein QC761_510890 [Podospora bellae-mahoneyi]
MMYRAFPTIGACGGFHLRRIVLPSTRRLTRVPNLPSASNFPAAILEDTLAAPFNMSSTPGLTTICRCAERGLPTSAFSAMYSAVASPPSPLGKRRRDDDSSSNDSHHKRQRNPLSDPRIAEAIGRRKTINSGSPTRWAITSHRRPPRRSLDLVNHLTKQMGNLHISVTFERYCTESRRLNSTGQSIFGIPVPLDRKSPVSNVFMTDMKNGNFSFYCQSATSVEVEMGLADDNQNLVQEDELMDKLRQGDPPEQDSFLTRFDQWLGSLVSSDDYTIVDLTPVWQQINAGITISGRNLSITPGSPQPAQDIAQPATPGPSVGGVPVSGLVMTVISGRPRLIEDTPKPAQESHKPDGYTCLSALRPRAADRMPMHGQILPTASGRLRPNNKENNVISADAAPFAEPSTARRRHRRNHTTNTDRWDKLDVINASYQPKSNPLHRVAAPDKSHLKTKKARTASRKKATFGSNMRISVNDTHYPQTHEEEDAAARAERKAKLRREIEANRAPQQAESSVEAAAAKKRKADGQGEQAIRGVAAPYVPYSHKHNEHDMLNTSLMQ